MSHAGDRDSTQRTKLIGEPVLLRFVGARAYVDYTVIFRLSRDPKRPGRSRPKEYRSTRVGDVAR